MIDIFIDKQYDDFRQSINIVLITDNPGAAMSNDKNLFALTQWILRAALVFNVAVIVIMICSAAAIAFHVDTKLISPAQFEQFTDEASGEISRGVANSLNTNFDLNISPQQLSEAAHKIAARVTRDDVARIAMIFLAGGAVCLILLQFILRAILRVVESASVGDPFIAKNADDLVQVAWLLLGMYAVQFLTGLAAHEFIPASLKEFPLLHMGHSGEINATGLFTVLLIFVLARIFRRGAEMRAELEATV